MLAHRHTTDVMHHGRRVKLSLQLDMNVEIHDIQILSLNHRPAIVAQVIQCPSKTKVQLAPGFWRCFSRSSSAFNAL